MRHTANRSRFILLILLLSAGATRLRAADSYTEPLRPQFHFTAKQGWLNDPNGLVFFDGEYHLFFQHNPDQLIQGPNMAWGHAVSPDLVHWKQLPIALPIDDHGFVWSGSAVVDWHDTTGLGVGTQPPLIAMYTAAKDPFGQAIAFSNDRGRTWTKYAGNPVIPHIANANRDPHAFWYEPTHRWVVILFKDVDETFCLFDSPDLKQWTHLQDIKMPGCGECPDFFPLAADGNAANSKWVMTAANGKYLVGGFDGRQFHPEQDIRQVDFGQNFYAVQTFNDIPANDGRRVQITWMRDGRYPGMPFNQQMSFPAELTLHGTPAGYRLFRNPVRELDGLHTTQQRWTNLPLRPGDDPLANTIGDLFDLRLDIDPGTATDVGLNLRGQTVIYHVKSQQLTALGTATVPLVDGHLHLQLLLDRTSLETFANDGAVTFTSCFLPDPSANSLSLFARGGTAHVRSLVVYGLKSAWH